MRWLVPAAFLVSGCYTQEKYNEDLAQANCDWYDRCELLTTLGFESVDDCLSEYAAWSDEDAEACEDYDANAAKDCVAGLEALGCGEDRAENYPAACADVCAQAE